jgi:hypothetical protein
VEGSARFLRKGSSQAVFSVLDATSSPAIVSIQVSLFTCSKPFRMNGTCFVRGISLSRLSTMQLLVPRQLASSHFLLRKQALPLGSIGWRGRHRLRGGFCEIKQSAHGLPAKVLLVVLLLVTLLQACVLLPFNNASVPGNWAGVEDSGIRAQSDGNTWKNMTEVGTVEKLQACAQSYLACSVTHTLRTESSFYVMSQVSIGGETVTVYNDECFARVRQKYGKTICQKKPSYFSRAHTLTPHTETILGHLRPSSER